MQLQELESLGAFVSDALVKREIKFKLDGDEELSATIYVKRLSMGEYEKLFVGKQADEQYGTSARIISEAVRLGEDGKEVIPVAKAFRLHKGIATAIIDAFNEVNRGKKA